MTRVMGLIYGSELKLWVVTFVFRDTEQRD